MALFILSFCVNAAITLPLSLGLFRNHPGMTEVYGAESPARRILACLYLTIGLISLYALVMALTGQGDVARSVGLTLFPLQIIYKLMTAVALRVTHPVVIANLCVVALLTLTLVLG